MKDSPLLHKFNKHLFFIIGLLILLAAAGYFLFGKQTPNSSQETTNKEQTAGADQAKENVELNQDGPAEFKPVREISADDHVWGDLSAPVKMIIYDDFECPFCANYYDTLEQAKKEFGDKLVIAFRHFPLVNIHVYSMKAAEASECASEQGKFWEMYHKLFENNKTGTLSELQFKEDARSIGLDEAKFDQCLFQGKYKDKVEAQMLEARSFNVNGTPTTFINGEITVGAYPLDDFTGPDGIKTEGLRSIIEKQLNK
jgi:protein-disulfide isomerase